MTETRTFTILPVSLKAYAEIRRAVILGDRADLIRGAGKEERIDLDGLAVERRRWIGPKARRREKRAGS